MNTRAPDGANKLLSKNQGKQGILFTKGWVLRIRRAGWGWSHLHVKTRRKSWLALTIACGGNSWRGRQGTTLPCALKQCILTSAVWDLNGQLCMCIFVFVYMYCIIFTVYLCICVHLYSAASGLHPTTGGWVLGCQVKSCLSIPPLSPFLLSQTRKLHTTEHFSSIWVFCICFI